MPSKITIAQWLNPPQGTVSAQAWSELAGLDEITLLHAAMNCARRGDAKSLTALFEHFEAAGVGMLMHNAQRCTLRVLYPDYGQVQPGAWDRIPELSLDLQSGDWPAASFERAVAVCLARRLGDGQVAMPRSLVQDRLELVARPRGSLDKEERQLLQAAIAVAQSIRYANPLAPGGVARLFFEVAAVVGTPDVARFFRNLGCSEDELATVPVPLPGTARRCVTPAAHAMLHGNVSVAHALRGICTHELVEHVFDSAVRDTLKAAQTLAHLQDFGRTIEAMRGASDLEDPRQDLRYAQLMELVARSHDGQPDASRLETACRLAASHIRGSMGNSRPWCDPVVDDVLTALRLNDLSPQAEVQAAERFAINSETAASDFTTLLHKHCVPMLRLLQPVLPLFLTPGLVFQAPEEAFQQLVAGFPSSAQAGASRLAGCVEILRDAGYAPLGMFRSYVTGVDGNQREEGSTSLLHLLARHARPGAVPAMLALVELGADPQAVDSVDRTPAQWLEMQDAAACESWERGWRSVVARRTALQALEQLQTPAP